MSDIKLIHIDDIFQKTSVPKNDTTISQYSNEDYLKYIKGTSGKIGSLKLTRLDECNDKHEADKIVPNFGDCAQKIYITCFSYNDVESMAMWGLYGKYPIKNRCKIDFNSKMIAELISNKASVFSDADMQSPIDKNDYDISFRKIAYIDDNSNGDNYSIIIGKTEYSISKHEFDNSNKKLEMAGLIKNIAWSYEIEQRIIVKLHKEIEVKALYLQLNDDICDSIQVMLGPWHTESNGSYKKSKFTNLVNNLICKSCLECTKNTDEITKH